MVLSQRYTSIGMPASIVVLVLICLTDVFKYFILRVANIKRILLALEHIFVMSGFRAQSMPS